MFFRAWKVLETTRSLKVLESVLHTILDPQPVLIAEFISTENCWKNSDIRIVCQNQMPVKIH